MSDADKYLEELNRVQDSHLHKQEAIEIKKTKDQDLKKFRAIRKTYRTGIPNKTGGTRLGTPEAEYFLGDRPRSIFAGYAKDDAREYFGEDYNASGNDRRKVTEEEFSKNRGKLQMIAHSLITGGWEPHHFMLGARLYEKLGKGKRIIPRLLKKVKEAEEKGRMKTYDYNEVKEFIKRNAGKREKTASGLEGKTMIFFGFILGGITLSIYSITTTGNAISDLAGTTKGLFGIILFIVGLAGLVFFGKK